MVDPRTKALVRQLAEQYGPDEARRIIRRVVRQVVGEVFGRHAPRVKVFEPPPGRRRPKPAEMRAAAAEGVRWGEELAKVTRRVRVDKSVDGVDKPAKLPEPLATMRPDPEVPLNPNDPMGPTVPLAETFVGPGLVSEREPPCICGPHGRPGSLPCPKCSIPLSDEQLDRLREIGEEARSNSAARCQCGLYALPARVWEWGFGNGQKRPEGHQLEKNGGCSAAAPGRAPRAG